MSNIQMQRTLLVGLGVAGAKTCAGLLTELSSRFGEVMIVQGVVITAEEMGLETIPAPLVITAEANFATWRADFELQVELALATMSQLSHLAALASRGIRLHRSDEIHIIIVADLTESWVQMSLIPLMDALYGATERTLACHASISGMMLYPGLADPEPLMNHLADLPHQFERGCFLAGLVNEAGLIMGETAHLIRATVQFLILLLSETSSAGVDWADNSKAEWNGYLSSFGIAVLRWPGRELAQILSARWSQSLLEQMLTLPQNDQHKSDLARQVREGVQQWLTGQKLSPPLLLDRLAVPMPPVPQHLAELVPELPWPWLFWQTRPTLEDATQQWQEEWLVLSRERLTPLLVDLRAQWLPQVSTWLASLLASRRRGAVVLAQSYLAEVSDLLQTFVAGVEQKKEEAEADLNDLDRQLGQAAGTLIQTLADFPASPLGTLLRWGRHPLKWPHYWTRCRQAQTSGRTYAHLCRGHLLAWQMVSYYEELLPFYQQLQTDWLELVARWNRACQQVVKASTMPALTDWPDRLQRCLQETSGLWNETSIASLYQELVDAQAEAIWDGVEALSDWAAGEVQAETMVSRLLDRTTGFFAPLAALSVDQAVLRQLPAEKAQVEWLAALVEQARPFWRYDETSLSEMSRAQVRLESWLFLPGGETSPLAPLVHTLSQPPKLLASRQPAELGLVTLRRIQGEVLEG